MADDLDDFLKQAAQRRKQRQQNKAERPPIELVPPPVLSPATSSVPTLSRSDDAYSRPNAPQSANRLEPMIDLSQAIETAQVVEENRLPSQVREQSSKPKKQKKAVKSPVLRVNLPLHNPASQPLVLPLRNQRRPTPLWSVPRTILK